MLDILTHENVGNDAKPPPPPGGHGEQTPTLQTDRVTHDGQIIGVVVADTYETAREAAYKVKVDYAPEPPSASFDSPGARTLPKDEAIKQAGTQGGKASGSEGEEHYIVGDAAAAFAAAPVKVDARYSTPTQHHNPLELFTTTAEWRDGKLTIHESSQFVQGLRADVAKQLGREPNDVRVLSRFVGGAFGSRGGTTGRTAWIAVAARRLGRPVKLEATRAQGFTIATYRAETRHHVRLAASQDGKLQAVMHEGWETTSRTVPYSVAGVETTARLYGSPNVWSQVNITSVDRNTPGFMRAPPETPYLFALESAMDELAYALAIDPIELRRINDTQREPIKGLPYTSRHLQECFTQASRAFGWEKRNPKPASMREGDWLIGYGCATAAYPANIGVSSTRITLSPEGKAKVEMGAQDIGTGTYTVIAQVAADRLGLPVPAIDVRIGDSDFPAAGLSAGSNHGSAVCNVVAKACEQIARRIAAAAVAAPDSPFHGRDPATLSLTPAGLSGPGGAVEPLAKAVPRTGGRLEVYVENIPKGAPPDGVDKLWKGQMAMARGSSLKTELRYSFGAQFVEVRVNAATREVRVPRAVGAFAAGTIINPVTARSQLMGGMIWGLSNALHEQTDLDEKRARYINKDLAEYLIPVSADIGTVEVIMIPETDPRDQRAGDEGHRRGGHHRDERRGGQRRVPRHGGAGAGPADPGGEVAPDLTSSRRRIPMRDQTHVRRSGRADQDCSSLINFNKPAPTRSSAILANISWYSWGKIVFCAAGRYICVQERGECRPILSGFDVI